MEALELTLHNNADVPGIKGKVVAGAPRPPLVSELLGGRMLQRGAGIRLLPAAEGVLAYALEARLSAALLEATLPLGIASRSVGVIRTLHACLLPPP